MGSASIDVSLENIWESWFRYRKGKKVSQELLVFQYDLEENLHHVWVELNTGTYQHGGYRTFVVSDNKKREISVAGIRDRVVHRLLYDYLNKLYDSTFMYDAWSCRSNKGLLGAIERAKLFFHAHPRSFVWRSDVKKFFDSVNHNFLISILSRKVEDPIAFSLTAKVIRSFSKGESGTGMPIGNLTSQIFSNIYFNEFDRFIKHNLKPQSYLRYGDDFIIIDTEHEKLSNIRQRAVMFLEENLKLSVNVKNDHVKKVKQGLKFLGVILYVNGHALNRRNRTRVLQRLNLNNVGSYFGLIHKHANQKAIKEFNWHLFEKIL